MKSKHDMPACAIGASAILLIMAGLAAAADSRLAPTVKIEKPGQCVEPVAEMRRDHMNMILHQRDATVHRGIRTSRHSLKNCIDCHANSKTNSVLGKDGFCESCHTFAAVRMDCFECHSPSPRVAASANKPVARRTGATAESAPRGAPVTPARVEGRAP